MVLLPALLAVSGLAGPAAAARIVCGSTIASNLTLTADLRCSVGDGLILSKGATLNLGGHKLIGSGAGIGVTMSGDGSSAVTNGIIKSWRTSINIEPASGPAAGSVSRVSLIDGGVRASFADLTMNEVALINAPAALEYDSASMSKVRVLNSPIRISTGYLAVTTSTFTSSPIDGFLSSITVDKSIIAGAGVSEGGNLGVRISNSTMNGLGAAYLSGCSESGVEIVDSRVSNYANGIGGYYCGVRLIRNEFRNMPNGVLTDVSQGFVEGGPPYTTIAGNKFWKSGVALKSGAMIVQDNTFDQNTTGVVFLQPQWSRATGNVLTRNADSGIYTDLPGLTVGRNKATDNRRYGIYAPNAVNLGGNVAYRNGLAQCVGLTCASS